MRASKLLIAVAATTAIAGVVLAQEGRLSVHLSGLGNSYSETVVSTLAALPADAPHSLTIDLADFGASDYYYVQVTVRFILTRHNSAIWNGVSIINSCIGLRDTGLTIYTGFTTDEADRNSDPRKNVNSHLGGDSTADCAENSGLSDNNRQAWDPTAGGQLPVQPAAVGSSLYSTPFTTVNSSQPLYSFVVRVPKAVGDYNLNFYRVLSGPPPDLSLRVKTNMLGFSPTGAPVQGILSVINGTISVVPEPASIAVLGSGIAALWGLRRRRKV